MEKAMLSRRNVLGTATALASATAISGRVQAANIPEAPIMDKATMQPPLHPTAGPDYNPVVTLNGWTLPWPMNGDWKEFHLVAEPVEREFAEGMKAYLWGYNGQAPGPTIEAVEGDKVRIFVTNRLPEHTTVHWHGVILPNGMDGVGGLNQPHIKPGKTFVYEFQFTKSDAQAGEGRGQGAVRSRASKRGDRRYFASEIEIALHTESSSRTNGGGGLMLAPAIREDKLPALSETSKERLSCRKGFQWPPLP
jgi:hypothetical protein